MAMNSIIEDSDKSDLRDLFSTWSDSLVKYVDYLYDGKFEFRHIMIKVN